MYYIIEISKVGDGPEAIAVRPYTDGVTAESDYYGTVASKLAALNDPNIDLKYALVQEEGTTGNIINTKYIQANEEV